MELRDRLNGPNSINVALAFVEQINAHNVAGLCDLMSEDHVFIDSLGNTVRGRETMRQGWQGYFSWFPDYQMTVNDTVVNDQLVAMFGIARGTYFSDGKLVKENRWEIPAAWRATVRDGLMVEWRVYADNSPVLRIMEAKPS